jgi:hypothetical protein
VIVHEAAQTGKLFVASMTDGVVTISVAQLWHLLSGSTSRCPGKSGGASSRGEPRRRKIPERVREKYPCQDCEVNALWAHVLSGECVHADDTTVPVLAKAKKVKA